MMTVQDLPKAVLAVINNEQQQVLAPNLDTQIGNEGTTIRDVIRQLFQDNGVEIEFSGKGAYEKGVVIDMDTDHMQQMGLNPDALRFGQTVVRVENPS